MMKLKLLHFCCSMDHGLKGKKLFAHTSPLYSEQQEALEEIINWFSDPTTSNIGTGSGKTVVCWFTICLGLQLKIS